MSRTLLVVVVVAGLMPIATRAAEKQCGLFSKDETCAQPSSRFTVMLVPGTAQPDRAQTVRFGADETTPVLVVRSRRSLMDEPIDCDMVRWVDSSKDPLIAKRPPTDAHYTMRVVDVPACPKPEPERAPIR